MNLVTPEIITKLNVKDALVVADSTFDSEYDREYIRQTYDRLLDGSNCYFDERLKSNLVLLPYFLYRSDEKPCGIGGLYFHQDTPSSFWLGWFGVSPQFHRKGFGKQIIEHTKDLVTVFCGKELLVYLDNSNNLAKKFYEKVGFSLKQEIQVDETPSSIYNMELC